MFEKYRDHLSFYGNHPTLSLWHVLGGRYDAALASGQEFAERTETYLAQRAEAIAAEEAATITVLPR